MFAKIAGVVAGLLVFFLYFRIIGTNPVFETLIGVALALAVGSAGWWETERWLKRRRRGKSRE